MTTPQQEPAGPLHGWPEPSATQLKEILTRTRTVAIVGASDKPARASYSVASYLLASSSYQLWFVKPRTTQILGRPVYPSLDALPGVPDLVDVFRRHEDLPQVLDDVLEIGAETLWLQLGLRHEEVARRGASSGLTVVMDRCLKVEHARFHDGLDPADSNPGAIASRRHVAPGSVFADRPRSRP